MSNQQTTEARRAAIGRLFAALSAGDLDTALSLYTDDRPTYSFPPALGLQPCTGKGAIRALYEQMCARFRAPLAFVPRHIMVEGDVGVIEWDHTATTLAGNFYENSGVHVVEFTPAGLIQHVRGYLDTAPIQRLNQLERHDVKRDP